MIVTLFYFPGDQRLAAKLSNWIATLGPNKGHTALLARDVRCHANVDSEILANFQKVFDKVEVITIVERVDGWPQGANVAFGRVAKHIQYTNPQPWLWIEPDCVPMKEGWVQALATEYDQEPRKPFLGDFVQVENVPAHMSGVGVYFGKITDYAGDATLAMETAWDVYAASQIVPQMKQTQLIQHKWKHPPFNNQSEVDNLLGQLKDTCVLFHADKSGTLIDFLRERRDGRKVEQTQSTGLPGLGKANPTCDIFIKSWKGDREWLEYCLKSIDKFCRGFRKIILVTSDPQTPMPVSTPIEVRQIKEEQGEDGYLRQQLEKIFAYTASDADYILHVDSDCVFVRPTTPNDFFINGKPYWLYSPYDKVAVPWKPITEKFIGHPVENEYMRRVPCLIPRFVHEETVKFCKEHHGKGIDAYIMEQPYRSFSEFNAMGVVAWDKFSDRFEWINCHADAALN